MALAFNNRGRVRQFTGRFDLSLADHDTALRLAPENPLPHANRGLLLLLMGKDTEAEREFELCYRLQPEFRRELIPHTVLAKAWLYIAS